MQPNPQIQNCLQACADWGLIPTEFKQCMTWEEQVLWLFKFLNNTVIPAVNTDIQNVETLEADFAQLQQYVDDYFDNLDVQQEINNKLDQMAQDGSLYDLIERFVTPYLNEQDEEIESFKAQINDTVDSINTKVNLATSITPIAVASTSDMTDTDRIYVNTTDGNWYYYNGAAWTVGGEYQSTGIARNSIDATKLNVNELRAFLKNKEINLFNNSTCTDGGFYNNTLNGAWSTDANFKSSDYIPVISPYYTIINGTNAGESNVCFFNSLFEYVGKTYSDEATYLTFAIDKRKYDGTTSMCVFNGCPQSYLAYLEIKSPISIYELDRNLLKSIYQDKIVNAFDKTEYQAGGFYNKNTGGAWVHNDNFISTGFIPVLGSTIYTNGANHITYYDKDLNYVGGTLTDDTCYLREAINTGGASFDIDDVMVCFGGQPSIHLDYLESQTLSPTSRIENIKLSLVGDSMVTDGYAPWKDVYRSVYNATLNTPVGGHGGDITVFSQYVDQVDTDCDAVIVWAGTNDWYHGQPMGSLTDAPSYGVNVLASWKYVLEYISTNLPTKKVLAITPSPRWYKTEDTPNVNQYGENINSQGYSLRELSDQIEKLCNLYSIPCINMMNLAGWNKNNYTEYLSDGIHQNSNGGYKVADLITAYLTNFVL